MLVLVYSGRYTIGGMSRSLLHATRRWADLVLIVLAACTSPRFTPSGTLIDNHIFKILQDTVLFYDWIISFVDLLPLLLFSELLTLRRLDKEVAFVSRTAFVFTLSYVYLVELAPCRYTLRRGTPSK